MKFKPLTVFNDEKFKLIKAALFYNLEKRCLLLDFHSNLLRKMRKIRRPTRTNAWILLRIWPSSRMVFPQFSFHNSANRIQSSIRNGWIRYFFVLIICGKVTFALGKLWEQFLEGACGKCIYTFPQMTSRKSSAPYFAPSLRLSTGSFLTAFPQLLEENFYIQRRVEEGEKVWKNGKFK